MTRGLLVGAVVQQAVLTLALPSRLGWFEIIFFGVGTAIVFALLGIIAGIRATKMEHIMFFANVMVEPPTILSGTFFSIDQLPTSARAMFAWNPMFYFVDGLRQGLIAHGETSLALDLAILVLAIAGAFVAAVRMFASGRGLKN